MIEQNPKKTWNKQTTDFNILNLLWHTFATTVTLSDGVSFEPVSKMLGHSSIRQTQHDMKRLKVILQPSNLMMKYIKSETAANSKPKGSIIDVTDSSTAGNEI